MNLYEAIYARYSVRKYRMEPVEDKIIEGIFRFLEESEPLFPEIKICVKIYPEQGEKLRFFGLMEYRRRIILLFLQKKRKE